MSLALSFEAGCFEGLLSALNQFIHSKIVGKFDVEKMAFKKMTLFCLNNRAKSSLSGNLTAFGVGDLGCFKICRSGQFAL